MHPGQPDRANMYKALSSFGVSTAKEVPHIIKEREINIVHV